MRDAERGQQETGPQDVPGLRLNAAMCRGGYGGKADGVLSGGSFFTGKGIIDLDSKV